MTAHKHAELIKAKVDNMDLVVMSRVGESGWKKLFSQSALPASDSPDVEYFLCHPKHEKACLHWLNGGEVYPVGEFNKDRHAVTSKDLYGPWYKESCFMCEAYDFCVKPRKESRWIGIYDRRFVTQPPVGTLQEVQELVLFSSEYRNCAPEGWQFIEIEVEV